VTRVVDFAVDVAAELDREGFVVVHGVITAATVAALQAATDELEAFAKDFVTDTVVRNSSRRGVFFEMQSQSGRKREPAVVPGALRKITGPSKGHAAFARLRKDAGILEVVRQSGLSHPRCVVDQVNFKHPQVGTGFPFHQDAAFLHGDARASLQRFGGLNVVVALDAADADNGGFTVLGGSHKHGLLRDQHGYDTSTMNEGVFDESRRQTPSLAPGDAVFFLPLLAHGSGPNLSTRRRRLATLWFVGGPG
jgi:ectoine hydroxylase-related dioxygenase (phytanoyl-CoA dioxygenase family)